MTTSNSIRKSITICINANISINVIVTLFLSSLIEIRVPFFLLFGFSKGAKGQKGTTQGPK